MAAFPRLRKRPTLESCAPEVMVRRRVSRQDGLPVRMGQGSRKGQATLSKSVLATGNNPRFKGERFESGGGWHRTRSPGAAGGPPTKKKTTGNSLERAVYFRLAAERGPEVCVRSPALFTWARRGKTPLRSNLVPFSFRHAVRREPPPSPPSW